MILTTCTACAAPLAHDAPRCVRCETRYCSVTCQQDHWRRGHEQICELIHRGGNAEKYHADKKYKEAVAVAVEACADDTRGQTCYICTEAVKEETNEGLVRGCACRGASGFAHVSCLARQAEVAVERRRRHGGPGWERWHTCGLCEQHYHGVVLCALGWACWKTYVVRPETDELRGCAMSLLGNGLAAAARDEEALSVKEAELAMVRRLGAPEEHILAVQSNLATTYQELGRLEAALQMKQDTYSGWVKLKGEEGRETIGEANNCASSLHELQRFEEAKSLLRKTMPVARRVLGESHDVTLRMRWNYAMSLYEDPAATLNDLREAVTTLEETARTARRVFGVSHPITSGLEVRLRDARAVLRARETPSLPEDV